MLEAAILQGSFKLVLALVGFIMARICLYWMDKYLVPQKFTLWLENADDFSKAVYFGARIIAIALLIGLALS